MSKDRAAAQISIVHERLAFYELAEEMKSWFNDPDLPFIPVLFDLAFHTFAKVGVSSAQVLGWAPEEMEGAHLSKFLSPEQTKQAEAYIEEGLKEGAITKHFENEYLAGPLIQADSVKMTWTQGNGETKRVVLAFGFPYKFTKFK